MFETHSERCHDSTDERTSVKQVSSVLPGMAESLTAYMTSEVISLKVATPGLCITRKNAGSGTLHLPI
jgi:hypothetical protein